MSALHLVRIPLRLENLARWAGERGWGGGKDGKPGEAFDGGRALHHLLVETFGRDAVCCFRLLAAPGDDTASLYLYSARDAETLREVAECAPCRNISACCRWRGWRASRCRKPGAPGSGWASTSGSGRSGD